VKRIVIAVDDSDGGRAAVESGIELARDAGAIATFVHVWHAPPDIVGEPYYQRRLSGELGESRALVADAERRADEAGVTTESELIEGDPAEQVLEVARLRDADLVVVGSRGRGAVAGALLGSVSSEVVKEADRPVLVVKWRQDAEPETG
jgi:nucleotide-binding universal stress UspA family protein